MLPSAAAAETVRFGFGGPEVELTLSAEHAAGLRATLAPYAARARRVRRTRVVTPRLMRIGVSVDPEWIGTQTL